MDLTLAAAYMKITNEALARNAETSVLVHKTKLIEEDTKRLKAEHEQLVAEGERLKAEGERLKAEGERLKAEGERLKAEGEAIADRNEKAAVHKKSREYYMNRRDTYPLNRKRLGQTFLIKTKLDKKIQKVVSGYILRKSLDNTPYEVPEVKFEHQAITNMLLNKKADKQPK